MESIFKRNGTLANVSNSIDTPEGVAAKDTPVGNLVLNYITQGLYSLVDKQKKDNENKGLFDTIKGFFSTGGGDG